MKTDLNISDHEILQALADWNDWNRPEPETVPRPFYENQLRALSATGEIVSRYVSDHTTGPCPAAG